jgi:hypothetical protein
VVITGKSRQIKKRTTKKGIAVPSFSPFPAGVRVREDAPGEGLVDSDA